MKLAIYYNRRVTSGVKSDHIWCICPWDPNKRTPQIGAFRFVEIKTECLLAPAQPETKWPTGVLVVDNAILVDAGDGMAIIMNDDSVIPHGMAGHVCKNDDDVEPIV